MDFCPATFYIFNLQQTIINSIVSEGIIFLYYVYNNTTFLT